MSLSLVNCSHWAAERIQCGGAFNRTPAAPSHTLWSEAVRLRGMQDYSFQWRGKWALRQRLAAAPARIPVWRKSFLCCAQAYAQSTAKLIDLFLVETKNSRNTPHNARKRKLKTLTIITTKRLYFECFCDIWYFFSVCFKFQYTNFVSWWFFYFRICSALYGWVMVPV